MDEQLIKTKATGDGHTHMHNNRNDWGSVSYAVPVSKFHIAFSKEHANCGKYPTMLCIVFLLISLERVCVCMRVMLFFVFVYFLCIVNSWIIMNIAPIWSAVLSRTLKFYLNCTHNLIC